VDITVRDNFLGLCDKNIVHKQQSDFDHLQSYGHLTLKKNKVYLGNQCTAEVPVCSLFVQFRVLK
jgi:hypothetical protein